MTEQQVLQSMGVADQLRGMLTEQRLEIAALVALGMVFGIATAGGFRLFKYRLDHDLPHRVYEERALALKRIAYAAGCIWTFLILPFFLHGGAVAIALLSVCLASIAGLGTPHMYDLLRWTAYKFIPAVGRYLLGRITSFFTKGAAP
jgi:hypothetical protein